MHQAASLAGPVRHQLKRNDVCGSRPENLRGALVANVLPHTKGGLIESHRPIEIPHLESNVGQAVCRCAHSDSAGTIPGWGLPVGAPMILQSCTSAQTTNPAQSMARG